MTAARMGRKPGPLAAALSAPPTLDGAACIGRWSLFDPQHDHEPAADTTRRHRTALRICQACPVLAACHRWAATLPATHHLGITREQPDAGFRTGRGDGPRNALQRCHLQPFLDEGIERDEARRSTRYCEVVDRAVDSKTADVATRKFQRFHGEAVGGDHPLAAGLRHRQHRSVALRVERTAESR